MASEGERIASVEATLREFRADIAAVVEESGRTRTRLHALETTTAGLVMTNTEKIRQEQRAQQRLAARMNLLMLLIALVGVVEPVAFVVAK